MPTEKQIEDRNRFFALVDRLGVKHYFRKIKDRLDVSHYRIQRLNFDYFGFFYDHTNCEFYLVSKKPKQPRTRIWYQTADFEDFRNALLDLQLVHPKLVDVVRAA